MNRGVGRRRLLAAGASATLASVAGCLSITGGDSEVPVELSVVNDTNEGLRVSVALEGVADDVGLQFGESYDLARGSTVVQLDVPPGEYTLAVVTGWDDDPKWDREVRWTVTEDDCTHRSWAVFTESDGDIDLSLTAQSCSTSEIHDGDQE